MKPIILLTAICALPGVANAGLQVSATPSDLGKYCYSEGGMFGRLYACDPQGAHVDMDQVDYDCPSDPNNVRPPFMWYNDIPGECYVGINNGIRYFCGVSVGDGDACGQCNFAGGNTSSWTDIGGNRVSRIVTSIPDIPEHDQTGWTCKAQTTQKTSYGCAAGYYSEASVASASMTCIACPTGGTSLIGTWQKTDCYIPRDSTFSDSTGSGTYTNSCYWKN